MPALFTLTFQGEAEVAGSLSREDERELARSAFPLTPPRDAAARPDFRAFKIAPLGSGRVLLSAVRSGGDRDRYGRPVLRADGCVLDAAEMAGALRDPTAVWEALGESDPDGGVEAFEVRVAGLSIHASPEAFALFRAELERSGAFYARAAAALGGELVDLYFADAGRAPDLLRPALGLLPLERLRRLHLAVGGEPAEHREPILGLAGEAPPPRRGGVLGGLFGRQREPEAVVVDFEGQEVHDGRSEGPRALAEAIADRRPWPGGLAELDRYRVLLACLDGPEPRSPFEVVPELGEMRRAVRRLEELSRELERWR